MVFKKENIPWNKGKKIQPHTEAWKIEMSKRNIGKANPFYGRRHNAKTKEKMRKAKLGKKLSVEHKQKISISLKKAYSEHRIEPPNPLKGKTYEEAYGHKKAMILKNKRRLARLGRKENEKTRAKMSKASKKRWENIEYRNKIVQAQIRGRRARPTSLEQKMIDFINENKLPYEYTGDGKYIIDGHCPDFINSFGEKTCLEVRPKCMCIIWNKYSASEYEQRKKEHYLKHGWNCIVIWQEDFDGEDNKINILDKLSKQVSV